MRYRYILGGLCWFSIPFSLATALGLASVAISLPITADEAGSGLVPPAVAQHLMGTGGSVLILIMLFMAVTSTGAAEQIAVSSLVAYDIFRTYIKPDATGKQIIMVSRIAIVGFGIFSGILGIILNKIGISLGWLYLFMGVVIGSAVFPVAFSISWSKCSGMGAIAGAITGFILGISSWLIYASRFPGGINIANTGKDEVMLTGNLFAILSSGIVCAVISFIKPDNCDWSATKAIPLIEEDPNAAIEKETDEQLQGAMKAIAAWGFGLTVILIIVWPVLSLPTRVFPKGYFFFWVVIAFIWGIAATAAMVILPVVEAVPGILKMLKKTPDTKDVAEIDETVPAADTIAEAVE